MIKIHICFFVEYTHGNKELKLFYGGIQNWILLLLPCLEKYEDLTITLVTKYSRYKPNSERLKIHEIHRFKNYKLDSLNFIISSFFQLFKIHRKNPFHFINLSGHDINTISPFLLKLLFKIPLMMEMPTDFVNYMNMVQMTEKNRFIAKIINISWFRFYKSFILKKINFMRSINKTTYKDLINLKYPREKMIQLPYGINLEKLNGLKKLIHEGVYYGFIGRLTKIKNLKFILIVFKDYFTEYPNDKLFIYGDGPEKEFLNNFIKTSKLSNNVMLVGWVKDIKDVYSNIDVLINASLGEGIPNVVLEAMATRTFIIASNVKGNNDVIKHNESGLLFNYNKNDFLKQLSRYRNRDVNINMILDNAAHELMNNYDIKKISDKLYIFLKSKL